MKKILFISLGLVHCDVTRYSKVLTKSQLIQIRYIKELVFVRDSARIVFIIMFRETYIIRT